MVFALSAGTTAFWAYGPLVLNVAFGIDPLVSGILMAIESLLWSLCTILVATRASNTESFFIRVGVTVASLGGAGLAIAMPLGRLSGIALCLGMQGAGLWLELAVHPTAHCRRLTDGRSGNSRHRDPGDAANRLRRWSGRHRRCRECDRPRRRYLIGSGALGRPMGFRSLCAAPRSRHRLGVCVHLKTSPGR